jgi:hypothetical protein
VRVIVHHAHHPDEGVYRLVHAEQEEVTVYDHVQESTSSTALVVNPNFVPAPLEGEDDDRTEDQKDPLIEQEVDEPGPPELVARTELVQYDHREIIWSADDERWKGMSASEIADEQRADVRSALHGAASVAGKEAKAAERAAEAAKDLGGVGEEL